LATHQRHLKLFDQGAHIALENLKRKYLYRMFDMWLTLVHEYKLYQFSDDISPLFGDIYVHQSKNYCTVIWRFEANN